DFKICATVLLYITACTSQSLEWYCSNKQRRGNPDPTMKLKPRKWRVVQWVSSLSQRV
ncbi:hypothetical protein K443DRAFT_305924, partial [Laccaria amethystina LaAM-08-1]